MKVLTPAQAYFVDFVDHKLKNVAVNPGRKAIAKILLNS